MCTKEEALKKVKDVELHIRKKPIESVAVVAGAGLLVGFALGFLTGRRHQKHYINKDMFKKIKLLINIKRGKIKCTTKCQ